MDKVINKPLVSVIMPAYNASNFIQEAINSVIAQTYTNWELIIIDDGSTDSSAEIIVKNVNREKRIKSFYQENGKQSKARNKGIAHARGEYIAILDADDIIFTERFAKQVAFLEANQDAVLCGSWFNLMGSDRIIKLPESHDAIKLALLNGNCIAHSSVMMRKKILDDLHFVYDESKLPVEDYDLWVRLVFKGKLYNFQEVLLDYRTHTNQVSKMHQSKQKQRAVEIRQSYFKNLELELLPEEQDVLYKILNDGANIVFSDIAVFKKLQIKLFASNTKKFFEPVEFKKYVLELELLVVNNYFLKRNKFTPTIYLEYLKIKNKLDFKLSIYNEFKLFIKSLIWHTNKS